jgi:hypothetical protein
VQKIAGACRPGAASRVLRAIAAALAIDKEREP